MSEQLIKLKPKNIPAPVLWLLDHFLYETDSTTEAGGIHQVIQSSRGTLESFMANIPVPISTTLLLEITQALRKYTEDNQNNNISNVQTQLYDHRLANPIEVRSKDIINQILGSNAYAGLSLEEIKEKVSSDYLNALEKLVDQDEKDSNVLAKIAQRTQHSEPLVTLVSENMNCVQNPAPLPEVCSRCYFGPKILEASKRLAHQQFTQSLTEETKTTLEEMDIQQHKCSILTNYISQHLQGITQLESSLSEA